MELGFEILKVIGVWMIAIIFGLPTALMFLYGVMKFIHYYIQWFKEIWESAFKK